MRAYFCKLILSANELSKGPGEILAKHLHSHLLSLYSLQFVNDYEMFH